MARDERFHGLGSGSDVSLKKAFTGSIYRRASDKSNHILAGNDVPGDLRELWRRLIFSLLASNRDDHLRNHGFLMRKSGHWSLSPAYDINPVPEMDRVRVGKTPIKGDDIEGVGIERFVAVIGDEIVRAEMAMPVPPST